jgi:hypothetical protein
MEAVEDSQARFSRLGAPKREARKKHRLRNQKCKSDQIAAFCRATEADLVQLGSFDHFLIGHRDKRRGQLSCACPPPVEAGRAPAGCYSSESSTVTAVPGSTVSAVTTMVVPGSMIADTARRNSSGARNRCHSSTGTFSVAPLEASS